MQTKYQVYGDDSTGSQVVRMFILMLIRLILNTAFKRSVIHQNNFTLYREPFTSTRFKW